MGYGRYVDSKFHACHKPQSVTQKQNKTQTSTQLTHLVLNEFLYFICPFRFRHIIPTHGTGQEEFDAITKAYYRGAQACVLAFSTTDRMSFEAVKEWKMKVKNVNANKPMQSYDVHTS